VTVLAGAPDSSGGVAIRNQLAPSPSALDQPGVNGHVGIASQVKIEARRAAWALHHAMVGTDARVAEESSGRAHRELADDAARENGHRRDGAGGVRTNETPGADSADQIVDHPITGETLRTQVSQGVRWGVIASIATQLGRFGFVAALMRLLGPENFGIVGQASVYIAITYIFLHLGTAATIIQRPKLERAEVGSAWWVNVVLGLLLAGLTIILAPVLAAFFRTEQLTAVLRVLSVCFVLKAMAVVPMALLYRGMRFRSLGIAEMGSTLLGGALAVIAAANGAGYWALVVMTFATDAIYLTVILWVGGRPEMVWSATAARGLWSFSSRVMGSELVRYMSENSDKVFVGRLLGATSLGFYSLAYRVLQLPMLMLEQAGRVILPTFSRLQDDRERLARIYLRITESLALGICPVMTLTILCAPVAVPAVFGDAWAPAVVPLQLLAAMTIQYMIFSISGAAVLAVGRASWEFRWSLFTMVVALIAFAVGINWGIRGVAASYLAMGLALSPIRFMIIQRIIPISAWGFLRSLAPAVVSSAALCGAWLLVTAAFRDTASGLPLAACGSAAGLAAYLVAAKVLWPEDLRYQLEFARQVVRGGGT
jgi:O-antigen/teichoic acid export membrane protein